MATSISVSGDASQLGPDEDPEVVELHWMKAPDITMNDLYGISAPALCGAWMEPDESLAARAATPSGGVRYVSCYVCDALHAIEQTR